jgi:hypothetical protein
MVMFTRLPLWRPMPEKVAGRLRVCWLSTRRLNKRRGEMASEHQLINLHESRTDLQKPFSTGWKRGFILESVDVMNNNCEHRK